MHHVTHRIVLFSAHEIGGDDPRAFGYQIHQLVFASIEDGLVLMCIRERIDDIDGCSTREIGQATAPTDLLVCRPLKQRKRVGPGLSITHKHDLVQIRQRPVLKKSHMIFKSIVTKNAPKVSPKSKQTGRLDLANNYLPNKQRTNERTN